LNIIINDKVKVNKMEFDKPIQGKNAVGAVTVLMMASSATHQGLINSQDSLKKHGFMENDNRSMLQHRVIGLDEKWGGWPHRMRCYRDAAAEIARSDLGAVVVCMDAYDALSVRSGDGLLKTFLSFDRPLVLSLEKMCMGNCKSLRDWWRTDGNPYLTKAGITNGKAPKDRYVNGGMLMGYAWAIRDMYNWMLDTKQSDDQLGLGRYALAHRDRWAPDVLGILFKNKLFGESLTEQDLAGNGVYFAHFPGMRDWSVKGYDLTVHKILGRPSGLDSRNLGSPGMLATYIVMAIIVIIALLLVAYTLTPKRVLANLGVVAASSWRTIVNAF